jgi:hypothetical protein
MCQTVDPRMREDAARKVWRRMEVGFRDLGRL